MTQTTIDIKAELTIGWKSRAKLRAEGAKLWAEGDKLWAELIIKLVGNITIKWTYIKSENYNEQYRCELGNGMTFEPEEA